MVDSFLEGKNRMTPPVAAPADTNIGVEMSVYLLTKVSNIQLQDANNVCQLENVCNQL